MARDLRLEISGDASRARQALAAAEDGVGKLRRETDRLESEFRQANREAAALDRQLLETAAATRALNAEYAKTGDAAVLKQLRAQRSELSQITKIRKDYTASLKESKLAQLADHEAAVKALKAEYMLFAPSKVKTEIKERQGAIASLRRELGMLGDEAERVAKSGGEAGGAAGGGMLGFLTSPAGIGTVAALAAPAGGAALAAAGAGAGAAAGFAAYAADPSAVKRAIQAQTDTFIQSWKDAGRQALAPTLDSINMIGDAVRHIDFDRIIGKGAEHLKTLAAGTAEAIDFLGKGFAGFIDKADPAVKALSDGMAKLGRATSIALDKISSGAEGGGEALADLFKILEAGIITLGTVVGWTEQLYHGLKKAGEGAGDFLASWNPMAHEVKKFVDERGNYVTVLTEIDRGAKAAAAGLADMSSQAVLANQAFATLFGTTMNLDQANLAVKLGLADLKKAAKDHSVSQDELTGKVLQQIQALQDQRQAQLNTGDGSQTATDRINANYRAQLEELKKLFPFLAELIDKYEELAKPLTKHIDIIISEKRIGSVSVEGVISGGDQRRNTGRGYASGTRSAPPGLAWVGEAGRPELVDFRGGERVYNPSESAALMRGWTRMASPAQMAAMVGGTSSSGTPVNVNINFSGNVDAAFATSFMKLVRTGRIQVSASAS